MKTNEKKAERILNELKAKDALDKGYFSIKINDIDVSPLSIKPHSTEIGSIKITKYYHSNGQLEEIEIEDKVLNTTQFTTFDEKGNLTQHITIKNSDKIIGVTVGGRNYKQLYQNEYDNNGNEMENRKLFYSNGQLKFEKIKGKGFNRYYENGQLECEYVKEDYEKRYYENGKIKMEFVVGEYQKVYDEEGKLLHHKDFFKKD
jgi:antitoxin component YwqK of YwqJK toxin-antitoxin module